METQRHDVIGSTARGDLGPVLLQLYHTPSSPNWHFSSLGVRPGSDVSLNGTRERPLGVLRMGLLHPTECKTSCPCCLGQVHLWRPETSATDHQNEGGLESECLWLKK